MTEPLSSKKGQNPMIYPFEVIKAIIDNVLLVCRMRATALGVLLDNTQRALDQDEGLGERKIGGRTWRASSVSDRSEQNQTFEEKMDRQINQLEAGVGRATPGFSEDSGATKPSITIRLDKSLKDSARDFNEDAPAPAQDFCDEEMENVTALQQT